MPSAKLQALYPLLYERYNRKIIIEFQFLMCPYRIPIFMPQRRCSWSCNRHI